jgi:hypothetical protein
MHQFILKSTFTKKNKYIKSPFVFEKILLKDIF